MRPPHRSRSGDWPDIPYPAWKDTCTTLHMLAQMAGKIRLVQTPWINHSWHVPLYLTARGLTTSPIPHGGRTFQIDFDFLDHELVVQAAGGARRTLPLAPRPVCETYRDLMAALRDLDLEVRIHTTPSEVPEGIPFEEDRQHHHYDGEAATRFWRALLQVDRVLKEFRARFIGKCSPVHFFWGSFDMAVSRFSGREAPPHPGGVPNFPDWVAREAYSHEVSSAGFWPGGGAIEEPAFYAYHYPAPGRYDQASVRPAQADYSKDLGEFLLPYEAVRTASSPDEVLLEFLQSTYEAGAGLAGWDRQALERNLTSRS